jgi:hypothetical protein
MFSINLHVKNARVNKIFSYRSTNLSVFPCQRICCWKNKYLDLNHRNNWNDFDIVISYTLKQKSNIVRLVLPLASHGRWNSLRSILGLYIVNYIWFSSFIREYIVTAEMLKALILSWWLMFWICFVWDKHTTYNWKHK